MRSVKRLHARAVGQLQRMLGHLDAPEAALRERVESVSRWSVAEHLGHVALSDQSVLERLDRTARGEIPTGSFRVRPPGEKPRPHGLTPAGRLVLWTGFIPRGIGRAPDPFVPDVGSVEDLRRDLSAVLGRLQGLAPHLAQLGQSIVRSRHLLFGELTAREWLRYLGVHHHHHLKIIRDIRKRAGF